MSEPDTDFQPMPDDDLRRAIRDALDALLQSRGVDPSKYQGHLIRHTESIAQTIELCRVDSPALKGVAPKKEAERLREIAEAAQTIIQNESLLSIDTRLLSSELDDYPIKYLNPFLFSFQRERLKRMATLAERVAKDLETTDSRGGGRLPNRRIDFMGETLAIAYEALVGTWPRLIENGGKGDFEDLVDQVLAVSNLKLAASSVAMCGARPEFFRRRRSG